MKRKITLKSFEVWQIEIKEGFPGVQILKFFGKNHYLVLGRHKDLIPGSYGDFYFECDSQGQGGYDVVASVTIGPSSVELWLKDEGTDHFRTRKHYLMTIRAAGHQWEKAKELLKHLLRDCLAERREDAFDIYAFAPPS